MTTFKSIATRMLVTVCAISGVVMIAAGFAVLAFVFALFESRRIKSIDPVRLLTAE